MTSSGETFVFHSKSSLNWPDVVHLSILDQCTVRYAPASGLWIFDSLPQTPLDDLINALKSSFQKLIDRYPILGGSLQFRDPSYGSLEVDISPSNSPGALFILERRDGFITLPNHGSTPIDEFIQELTPPSNLLTSVFSDSNHTTYMTIVKLTVFSTGQFAIGFTTSHQIADSKTVISLVKEWSGFNASILDPSYPEPSISLDFISGALDLYNIASLNSSSSSHQSNLIKKAKKTPLKFYDIYNGPIYPFGYCPLDLPEMETVYTEGLPFDTNTSDGDDTQVKNDQTTFSRLVYISPDTIDILKKAISTYFDNHVLEDNDMSISKQISTLDIIQSYVWITILLSRGITQDDLSSKSREICYHYNFDYRQRIKSIGFGYKSNQQTPTIPGGSPVGIATISLHHDISLDFSIESLSKLALAFRKNVLQLNADGLQSVLHLLQFDPIPSRIWGGFLTKYNIIVTSWHSSGLYDITFNGKLENRPIYAQGIVPPADGILNYFEANAVEDGLPWYSRGVVVSLTLKHDVMNRFLSTLTPDSFMSKM